MTSTGEAAICSTTAITRRRSSPEPSPRSRARQDLDPRGAGPGPVSRTPLRGRGGRVRGDRHARPDERLCPVLPGSLDAAAGPPSRGLPAAGAGVLAGAQARRLPALPRPRPARRGRRLRGATRQVSGSLPEHPMLSSTDSFRTGVQMHTVAGPRVGARPLFLRQGPVARAGRARNSDTDGTVSDDR